MKAGIHRWLAVFFIFLCRIFFRLDFFRIGRSLFFCRRRALLFNRRFAFLFSRRYVSSTASVVSDAVSCATSCAGTA